MNRDKDYRAPRHLVMSISVVVAVWLFLFIVLPVAFKGPMYGVCSSARTCTTVDTTRWYWLGGYHAAFGPQGKDYPAVIKYWPTSTWEMWLLGLVSLIAASMLYFGVRKLLDMKRG